MRTLKEWADFYRGHRIWIFPYHDCHEAFKWLHWRNMNNSDYEDEYKTYNWYVAAGINVVAGKKGIIVARFRKDEDARYSANVISKVLTVLGLPKDYDWVIEDSFSFSILVDVCNMPVGRINRKYKDFELIYEEAFILPPGIDQYECNFRNGLPSVRPSQISWNLFSENLQEIEKIPIVFRGYSKEQKQYAAKMKFVAGCILVIVIALITGLIAISNSLSIGGWFGMFLVTLGVAVGLIYIMSH